MAFGFSRLPVGTAHGGADHATDHPPGGTNQT
jgi:hypothetical protein